MEEIIQFPTIQQTIRKLKDDNTFETQFDTLLHFDLVKKDDEDRDFIQRLLSSPESEIKISSKEERAIACFVGSAIGDTLGNQTDQFVLDYNRNEVKDFNSLHNLRSPRALYTDDTSLALCIADSFLANKLQFVPSDIRHRFVLWWYESYNNGKSEYFKDENKGKKEYDLSELKENVKRELWNQYSFGVGITTFNSFLDFVQSPSKTRLKEFYGDQNSNGSLMRLSPIPILFHDNIQLATQTAHDQSLLTNDGQEAAEACMLLAYIIVKVINIEHGKGLSTKQILDEVLSDVEKEIVLESSVLYIAKSQKETSLQKNDYNQSLEDRNWDWKSINFKYSPTRSEMSPTGIGAYALDALAMSLHLNYHSESYSQVVCKAANLGGDTDTVGCIAGMLAGALFGLSKDLLQFYQSIYPAEKNKIALRAYKLFHKKFIS